MDRIAISIVHDEKGLNDLMDERFGRAEAFLVVDAVTGEDVRTEPFWSGRRARHRDARFPLGHRSELIRLLLSCNWTYE